MGQNESLVYTEHTLLSMTPLIYLGMTKGLYNTNDSLPLSLSLPFADREEV